MQQRNRSLEKRICYMTANLETMRGEQSVARAQWDVERIALSEALRDAKAQGDRWGTIESMLSSLQPLPGAVPNVSPST